MDRILIILKKENGPRASSAPALGLNTIMFIVYQTCLLVYAADSGERLQGQWSSGLPIGMILQAPIRGDSTSMIVLKCLIFWRKQRAHSCILINTELEAYNEDNEHC